MHVRQLFDLTGKIALVTGGAGIFGRQIVLALAEAGATTIVASRDVEKLQAQASDLAKGGLKVEAAALDQGDETSIQSLARTLAEKHGRVDVLVNNAVLRPMKSWADSAAAFAESMRINATGMFLMTRVFGDQMAERGGGGSIINIGSIQGCVGPDFTLYDDVTKPPPPDYFFHKGGLVQLTKYAAALYGKRNVRANCISPGGFQLGQSPTFIANYNARTFLGRMAGEEDLKGAIVFFASEASRYITGTNLAVDGGYTAK